MTIPTAVTAAPTYLVHFAQHSRTLEFVTAQKGDDGSTHTTKQALLPYTYPYTRVRVSLSTVRYMVRWFDTFRIVSLRTHRNGELAWAK